MKRSNAICLMLTLVVSLTLVALLGYAYSAPATKKPYYEGKTITFIVPNEAGGGTDITARVWAKWLAPHIPGKPTIIIRNMPGAAGSIGSNYAYGAAPKDGTTLLVGNSNTSIASLLQTKGVKFDQAKMPIVCVVPSPYVLVSYPEFAKTGKDLLKGKGLIFGQEPLPNPDTAIWLIVKDVWGFKSKDVLAFQGAADRGLAWFQKETNLTWQTPPYFFSTVKPLIEKGEASVVLQSGLLNPGGKIQRSPAFPDLPHLGEVWKEITGKEPSGIEWEACLALIAVGRSKPLFLPPGIDMALVDILRGASSKMAADPEYQAASNKVFGGEITYAGEDARKIMDVANATAEKVRPWLQQFMEKRGGVKF